MAENSATVLFQNIKANVSGIANLPVKSPISNELKYIDKLTQTVIDQAPWVVLKVGVGVIVILLGWMLSGWLASKLTRWLVRAHMEETLANFLASTARFVLFFNIFIVGLTVIGVSSTSIAAFLGAMGLAIGFALRGTFASVAAGVMLMVHRPIRVGDSIDITSAVGSPSGVVKRVGLFSTEINSREHVRVFIPNALLWENVLRNDTYNRMRMVKVEFGIGHEVNLREAFALAKSVASANPLSLKSPEPHMAVDTLTEAGVMCSLEVWGRTEDRKALQSGVLLDVIEAFGKAGLRMAHQTQDGEKTAADAGTTSRKKIGKVPVRRGKVAPNKKG